MKVFISWSGEISRQVALVLRDWLPSVIQAVEPYVSSEDTEKGTRWPTEIAKELESTKFGITCVTPDNVDSPWLNFESGAISKSAGESRVWVVLYNMKPADLRPNGPLTHFQATIFEMEDLGKLINAINRSEGSPCLDQSKLDSIFQVWWPILEKKISEVSTTSRGKEKEKRPRTDREMLEELLDLARTQQRILLDRDRGAFNFHNALKSIRHEVSNERLLPRGLSSKAIQELRHGLEYLDNFESIDVEDLRRVIEILRRPISHVLAVYEEAEKEALQREVMRKAQTEVIS